MVQSWELGVSIKVQQFQVSVAVAWFAKAILSNIVEVLAD